MSLFDPYPSDGDSVLWSDESSSSTARYARLVPPPPPPSHEICSVSVGRGCWVWLLVHLPLYYRQVLGLTSSMPILLLGHCFVSRMYHSHLHCCRHDDLCWTVLCPLLCAQLPFVTFCYVFMVIILTYGTTFLDIHI